MPRVIKKYSNRKLYDVDSSKYVTLEDIGKMVEQGIDLHVIDNETGEDISRKILAQILVTLEKQQKSYIPFPILRDLIQKSGDSVVEYTKRSIMAGIGAISAAEEEVEKVVRHFSEKGHETEEETHRIIKELLSSLEKSKDTFDKKIEDSIVKVLKTLSIPSYAEVTDLKKKISELEAKLEALSKKKAP